MAEKKQPVHPYLDRRELFAYAAYFGPAFLAAQGLPVEGLETKQSPQEKPTAKQYQMKKSINMWALPYPEKMSLDDCLALLRDAGFEGVELNYAEKGELSVESSLQEVEAIGRKVRSYGLEVSGLCSFLFWPYPLTSNDRKRRERGLQLAHKMIDVANALGTENLLVVPGAVYIPWAPEPEPVPNDLCWERAKRAVEDLIPHAERRGVYLNIENIFANGFLCSPQEMVEFVDSFGSPWVRVHFDIGNIAQYQFPEHWIRILGSRIKNVHLKEFNRRLGIFSLDAFRPLLDGTTNWPAVMEELDRAGYRGWLTFEYFRPFEHWPEVLVYQTSMAMDRMLGRA